MRKIVFAGAAAALGATAALAADSGVQPDRYTLTPSAGGGYVRLDKQTGHVSECTGAANSLVCKSTPDERAAMQAEIDRLQKLVDDLKAAAPKETAQNSILPHDEQDFEVKPGPQVTIPSDQDVDKAINFMDHVVKRFKGLIQELHSTPPSDSTPL